MTRNTLDRILLARSRLFLKISFFVLSVYTLPCEISPISDYICQQSLYREGKVWSLYIHNVNQIMQIRDIVVLIF